MSQFIEETIKDLQTARAEVVAELRRIDTALDVLGVTPGDIGPRDAEKPKPKNGRRRKRVTAVTSHL